MAAASSGNGKGGGEGRGGEEVDQRGGGGGGVREAQKYAQTCQNRACKEGERVQVSAKFSILGHQG